MHILNILWLKPDLKYVLYPMDSGGKVSNIYIILYFFFVYCTSQSLGELLSILGDPSNFHFVLAITWSA